MVKMNKGTEKYTFVEHEENYEFNAPHHYVVRRKEDGAELVKVDFQCGPIKEYGVNGCCNEDLINMVIERLEGFQESRFKCRENALAITKLEEALLWLRKRTMDREAKGIEGTNKV